MATMKYLAENLRFLGQTQRAVDLYRQIVRLQEKVSGRDDFDTLASCNGLGATLMELRHYSEAEQILREASGRKVGR
ncbi:hypothetical protein HJFPF1_00071 [Paramyrothecium foliicola]|nr:hypothetical protein HJFPF1_00071 [Paramyrothecium foliicola]